MSYRLICIYETYTTPIALRIEVALETGSKSLPPFQRKVTVDDLLAPAPSTFTHYPSSIIHLLSHAGLQSQPFRIPQPLLRNPQIIDILKSHPYNYLESAPKGSLKKGVCPLKPTTTAPIPTGQLIGGELYIDHPASWHHNIKVRLRYSGALNSFYPSYSPLPFITTDGQIFQRNLQAEQTLLSTLGCSYNVNDATLSFNTPDTLQLQDLTHKGWTLYVSGPQKKLAKVFTHSEPSGIVWFSTDQETPVDFAQQLLEGYLHSRHYHESDGHISLFCNKDIEKSDDKKMATLRGATSDVLQLYQPPLPLSDSEIREFSRILDSNIQLPLRPYQHEGVLWLLLQRKNHHGCLLADEMGLGKTLQVIAHLCCLGSDKHHLIIAPTSLIYNWQHEVLRFAPHLLPSVTLVSYDMLRIRLDDYIHRSFDTIVIDEAQIIKNRQTKKYQAISQLSCQHKIILTGTPIENSIDELWSHFMMLMPPMQSLYHKLQRMCVPAVPEVYVSLTSKLLKPFILRRVKQDVLTDLPERIEKTVYIELSEPERMVYRQVHTAILQAFATGISGRVSSIALEGLLRLRQTCVSPNLLPQNISHSTHIESTKLQTALDLILSFQSESRQVLVFSQFVSALHEMEQLLLSSNIRFVTLYGDTRDRETPVRSFQTDKNFTAFLISLKAGGVGLNLTAADRVILLDDWWNPAVEDQAMSRSHRFGQRHDVMVFRLVCKDTVEEKILQLQDQKRQTVNLFNATSEKLTLEELKILLTD